MARIPAKRWRTRADVLYLLARAKAEIDSRVCDGPSLRQIAQSIGLSPFHFQKLFRRLYRESPHEYLTRSRLAIAKELIEDGEMTVSQACAEVGFRSLASFSRLFRKHHGIAPGELRRRPAIPPRESS